jgi:hypothetical protein
VLRASIIMSGAAGLFVRSHILLYALLEPPTELLRFAGLRYWFNRFVSFVVFGHFFLPLLTSFRLLGAITTMKQFQQVFGELQPLIRGVVVSVRFSSFFSFLSPSFPSIFLPLTFLPIIFLSMCSPPLRSQIILVPSGVTGVLAGTVSDRLSRKYTISLGSAIFAVGSAISAASKTSLGVLILGRCIAGTGEGLFLGCLGVYLCEIAPRHLRSQMLLIQQLICTGGVALGFFVCYGVSFPSVTLATFAKLLRRPQAPPKSTERWLGGSPSFSRLSLRLPWPSSRLSSLTLPEYVLSSFPLSPVVRDTNLCFPSFHPCYLSSFTVAPLQRPQGRS